VGALLSLAVNGDSDSLACPATFLGLSRGPRSIGLQC